MTTKHDTNAIELKNYLNKGGVSDPFWFCGPCIIEDIDTVSQIAETIKRLSEKHQLRVVFKASFDKANRSSVRSFRSRGVEESLNILAKIKRQFELPIVTDIHETHQAAPAAEVADILQIPAFLCRQTDLIREACNTGKLVNVKKGQFLDPSQVRHLVEKLKAFGAKGYWITERGVSFGYQRLVVDFAAFPEMQKCGAPLILDITHAVQLPGGGSDQSGGIREAIPYLAKAGAAVGVQGFFAETHPDPPKALSDSTNAWPLDQLENLMVQTKRIANIAHEL